MIVHGDVRVHPAVATCPQVWLRAYSSQQTRSLGSPRRSGATNACGGAARIGRARTQTVAAMASDAARATAASQRRRRPLRTFECVIRGGWPTGEFQQCAEIQ